MNTARSAASFRRRIAALSSSAGLALPVGLSIAIIGLLEALFIAASRSGTAARRCSPSNARMMINPARHRAEQGHEEAQSVGVLLPLELVDVLEDPPHDLRDRFAHAFARFPYVESFFVWNEAANGVGTFDMQQPRRSCRPGCRSGTRGGVPRRAAPKPKWRDRSPRGDAQSDHCGKTIPCL